MRFSVKILLTLVALSAICISSLVASSEQSLRTIASLTIALNFLAGAAALVGTRRLRAFAIGFLIACLGYVAIAFWFQGGTRYLVTDVALQVLDHNLKISEPKKNPLGEVILLRENGFALIRKGGTQKVVTWDSVAKSGFWQYAYYSDQLPGRSQFMLIGHFIWAIALGCANGGAALWLVRNQVSSGPSRSLVA